MKYTVLAATTLTAEAVTIFHEAKDVDLITVPPEARQVLKVLPNADALIIRDELQVDASMITAGKRLRVIGRAGVGLAGIDVETATSRGVIVMNTPGANAV